MAENSRMMVAFFILVSLVIFGFMYGYIGLRLWPTLQPAGSWKVLYISLLIVFTFLPVLALLLQIGGQECLTVDIIAGIGYFIMGFGSLVLVLFLVRDLGWLAVTGLGKVVDLLSQGSNPVKMDPARRSFILNLTNYGLVGLAGLGTIRGVVGILNRPKLFTVSIPVENLPRELESMRIVQISDFHAGPTVKRKFVETVVKDVQQLKPDLLVFTGDLVDGTVNYLAHDVEPLADLNPPFGKFFVTGNHEYYSGIAAWTKEIERLGFTVLTNSHQVVSYQNRDLLLVGITDPEARRMDPHNAPDLEKALNNAPEHDVSILLAHQPSAIHDAAAQNMDVQLSGHTHGGQYWPWNVVVEWVQPYSKGLHKHGPTWIYVNRGTGYWGPPLRISVPSEITLIKLISA
jgi:hypothetical protein